MSRLVSVRSGGTTGLSRFVLGGRIDYLRTDSPLHTKGASMLQGFKDFVLRGNIVDLAVAVVIGSAFAAVVDTVVSSLISPILTRLGGSEVKGFGPQLGAAGNEATLIDIGAMINAMIVFLITAAVVYFIFVLPMNRLVRLRARGEEDEPAAPTEDVIVLREIRDLLAARNSQP